MTTAAMETDSKPFDDITDVIMSIPEINRTKGDALLQTLATCQDGLTPMGKLDWSLARLANWQDADVPAINRPIVTVFVGTHDIARHITGSDPIASAKKRIETLSTGRVMVRGLAASIGAGFKVFDMGISHPAADMRLEPSLSERNCAASIAFGMEAISENADVIVLGNAGIGSATAAAGIARGLYGGTAQYWAGGINDHSKKRIEAVDVAASRHNNLMSTPLDVLRCFGGRDIAGMLGAILAARHQKIPVILDGFVCCAAAAVLHEINPKALEHCIAAHITTEPAHGALLDRIGMKPILDMGVGIGDGTGATMLLSALKSACAALADV